MVVPRLHSSMHKKEKKSSVRLVLLFLFLACAFGVAWAMRPYISRSVAVVTLLVQCRKTKSRLSCYEKNIPLATRQLEVGEAFKVVDVLQKIEPEVANCHNLAHEVSYEQSRKPGVDWKDVLTQCPLAQCNYGCLHGSVIGEFRGRVLTNEEIAQRIPELRTLCQKRSEWHPSILDQSMCYHVMGHVAMYVTGGDLQRSFAICNATSPHLSGIDHRASCEEGVFMTLLYTTHPSDRELFGKLRPGKDEVFTFCSGFDNRYAAMCRRESASYFITELKNPAFLAEFCSFSGSEKELDTCYFTVLNRLTDFFMVEPTMVDQVRTYCAGLPQVHHARCIKGAVFRLLQTDYRNVTKALSLCRAYQQKPIEAACYNAIASYVSSLFVPGQRKGRWYCKKLPRPWSDTCAENLRN